MQEVPPAHDHQRHQPGPQPSRAGRGDQQRKQQLPHHAWLRLQQRDRHGRQLHRRHDKCGLQPGSMRAVVVSAARAVVWCAFAFGGLCLSECSAADSACAGSYLNTRGTNVAAACILHSPREASRSGRRVCRFCRSDVAQELIIFVAQNTR